MKKFVNFKLIGAVLMCISYIGFICSVFEMNDNVIDNLIIDAAAFLYVAIVSARCSTYEIDTDDKIQTIGYILRFGTMLCFGLLYTWWAVEGIVNMLIGISPLLTVIAGLAIGICSICNLFIYVIYINECHERYERDKKETVCR